MDREIRVSMVLDISAFTRNLSIAQRQLSAFNRQISGTGTNSIIGSVNRINNAINNINLSNIKNNSLSNVIGDRNTTTNTNALSASIGNLGNSLRGMIGSLSTATGIGGVTQGLGLIEGLLAGNLGFAALRRGININVIKPLQSIPKYFSSMTSHAKNFVTFFKARFSGAVKDIDMKPFERMTGFLAKMDTNKLKSDLTPLISVINKGIVGFAALSAAISAYAINVRSKLIPVQKFFQTFGDTATLKALQDATGGMVSDIELMSKSNLAVKLGVDAKNLPMYFKFAAITAAETGQSVDYLVESIVTGIGRKSVRIIDNLGISQSQLNDEIKKTGDFEKAVANLIQQRLSKSVTTVDDLTNGFTALGTAIGTWWDAIANSKTIKVMNSIMVGWGDILKIQKKLTKKEGGEAEEEPIIKLGYLEGLRKNLKALKESLEKMSKEDIFGALGESTRKAIKNLEKFIKTAEGAKEKVKEIPKVTLPITTTGKWTDNADEPLDLLQDDDWEVPIGKIERLQEAIKLLTELRNQSNDPVKIAEYNRQIGLMDKSLKKLTSTQKDLTNESIKFSTVWSDILISAFQNVGYALGDLIEDFVKFSDTEVEFGKKMLQSFGSFLTNMGKMMIGYGSLIIAQGVAQKAFENGGAITKIVAGAAMIAIGAAVVGGGAAINKAGSSPTGNLSAAMSSANCNLNSLGDMNRSLEFKIRGRDLVALTNDNLW